MTGRAATPTHYHLHVRIPGWLLAAALLVPTLFLGWKFAADQFDRASPDHGPPVRVTVLERKLSSERVATIRMLIETNDELDPFELNYAVTIQHTDGTNETLPASATVLRPGDWKDHSAIVEVSREIPVGARFERLDIQGPTWGSGVGRGEELYEPRLARDPAGTGGTKP